MDYTLSRVKQGIYNLYCVYYIHYKLNVVCITAENCVSYNNLELLPWLFEGKGDDQLDVYDLYDLKLRKVASCMRISEFTHAIPT